jgi:hypothetical protein
MPLIPFASNFLAGSLISLLMPVGLLIAIVLWYTIAIRRVPSGRSKRSEGPPADSEPQAGGNGAPSGPGSNP